MPDYGDRGMSSSPPCPANNLPAEVKDVMWYFLMQGGQRASIPALKEAVNELCRATMQKNAGQEPYCRKTDISWSRDLDSIMWRVVMEATALVLSGRLDELEVQNEQYQP